MRMFVTQIRLLDFMPGKIQEPRPSSQLQNWNLTGRRKKGEEKKSSWSQSLLNQLHD